MDISIRITSKKKLQIKGKKYLEGKITIGDFSESIFVLLGQWNRRDYERQWREGLERLKIYKTSCLVESVSSPKESAVVGWWRLYRVKNTVFVQMGYISHSRYKRIVGGNPFTPETCYAFIEPRKKIKEESIFKISEWSVPWIE